MVLEICYWTASLAEGWRIDFVREAKRRPRVDRPRKSRVNPPSGTLAGAIVAVRPLIKKCSTVPWWRAGSGCQPLLGEDWARFSGVGLR